MFTETKYLNEMKEKFYTKMQEIQEQINQNEKNNPGRATKYSQLCKFFKIQIFWSLTKSAVFRRGREITQTRSWEKWTQWG